MNAIDAAAELKAVAKGNGVVVQAGRDIINGNVFSGSFARLRDVWLDPEPVFDEVQVEQFAGREWLIERVDRFIHRHDRGYVVIQAPAGIGKTMVAAWLAKQRGWPCHFTRRRRGCVTATALRNLAAQIIAGYQLSDQFTPGGMLPETAGEPGWFEQVLRAGAAAASAAGRRLVVVVDGLDEAESFDGDLPLGLPTRLPSGVIMVVTCRTGSRLLGMRLPWETTTFDLTDERNLADMRLFLQRIAVEDTEIEARLSEAGMQAGEFVDHLLDRCGGVWVYLRYILDALRLGLCSPLNLDELPSDLAGYYAEELRPAGEGDDERTTLLITLAAVTEPLPVAVLAELAGLPDVAAVERLCTERLRPFLTCAVDGQQVRRYGIYHVSLRDYLHGASVEPMLDADRDRANRLARLCRAAHSRIADNYLAGWGGLQAGLPRLAANPALADRHHGYGLRNIALHLDNAHRDDDLHLLLATTGHSQNVWFAAHDRAGTLVDYVTDIRRAQRLAAAEVTGDVAAGRPAAGIGLELRYVMMQAAVVSLANNVPISLVVRLVELGVWSAERALGHARQLRLSVIRGHLLAQLLPLLPRKDRASALAEAIAIAQAETDSDRLALYASIVTGHPLPVPGALVDDALEAAAAVEDDDGSLSWWLGQMAPRLDTDGLARALDIAGNIEPEGTRFDALERVAPHLSEEHGAVALALGRALTHDYLRAMLIEAMAPALSADALVLARTIDTPDDRAEALIAAGSHMPPPERGPLIAEALAAARQCDVPHRRAHALGVIASAASDDQRRELLRQAVDTAEDTEHVVDRVWALAELAPRLESGAERQRIIADCLAAIAAARSDEDRVAMAAHVGQHANDETLRRICELTVSLAAPERVRLLSYLADNCPRNSLGTLLEVIREAPDLDGEASALAALAARATPELCGRILPDVAAQPSSYQRQNVLGELAPQLPAALLGQALDTVRSITDEYGRACLLARLADRLPQHRKALFEEAVTTAQGIVDSPGRIEVLAKLIPDAPGSQRAELQAEALAVALRAEDPRGRFFALMDIVDQLDGESRTSAISVALTCARSEQFDGPRSYALGEIARLNPDDAPDLLGEAVSAAREHPNEKERPALLAEVVGRMPATPERQNLLREAMVLAARTDVSQLPVTPTALRIAKLLPEATVVRCLATVREFVHDDEVPDVVGEVIRWLPGPLLAEAVNAIAAVPSTFATRKILGVMVPYLPEPVRETALRHALSVPHQWATRESIIAQATAVWPARLRVAELDIIRRCLNDIDLNACFGLLAAASDLLVRIGGEDVHLSCLDNVRAVQRWWPRFAALTP